MASKKSVPSDLGNTVLMPPQQYTARHMYIIGPTPSLRISRQRNTRVSSSLSSPNIQDQVIHLRPIHSTSRPPIAPVNCLLLPLAAIIGIAHAWQITATLVSGQTYTLQSAAGTTRACDGLPIISSAVDFFSWTPNAGATVITLYTGINCTGAKRVGTAGVNDVNPNTIYVAYMVSA